jgi:hypothetical protein
LNSQAVNQVMAQWAQDQRTMTPNSSQPEYVINGFGILGGNGLANWAYTSNISRFTDDLAIVKGRTTLHLGGDFAYDPARQRHEANLNGQFDYNSLPDFIANTPRRYQQTFVVGDPFYDGSVRFFGLYVDAKFTVTKRLTVTAGLRWDAQWNPQPTRPNTAIPVTTHIPNDLNQWQPRLGAAWNPATNTVVRLSAGLYDTPTPATYFQRVFTDNGLNTVVADSYYDPQILALVAGGSALPVPPAGLTTPEALVVGINPSFRNPRSFQVAGSVEQQVTTKISLSGGYIHNSTWDLQQMVSQNLFPPTYDAAGMPIFPTQRPDPAIGQLLLNEASAHSSYNGMLVTANFQLPKRSQLVTNYTLSRTRDNNSNLGPFTRVPGLNPFNLSADGSDSTFDVRNSFNISAITNLPYGFKINPILVARSGVPYTSIIGFDTQNDGNDWNDRAIVNNKVVARNSYRQPAFFNLDLRFVKDFALKGEGRHLDLFMDIFSITGAGNRNFGPEAVSLFGTPTLPFFSATQALYAPDTNHFGSARQFQFTVRFTAF